MGRTAFKDALKLDPSLWVQCGGEWVQGPGYRDRVARWNREWFNEPARQEVESELFALISREWAALLKRISTLLHVDELEPATA